VEFIYRSRLFKQLIGVIFLLIFIAIGIPSAFSFFYISPNFVESRYHQIMKQDAEFLAARLDWLLTKSMDDVELLASKLEVSDPEKIKESKEVLDIFVKGSAMFTGGIVTDNQGIMLLFNSTPQGNIELQQKNDLSYRNYIQYPLTQSKSYMTDIVITQNNPFPVIFLSSPIVENGRTTGVLALSINLLNEDNIFQSLVHGFREKKKGSIYVIDGQGSIVYHMNKEMVGKTADGGILSEISESREETHLDNVCVEYGNIAAAFTKLNANDWVVVYEMSHDEIYAMRSVGRIMTVGTMGLVLLLGLVASSIFAKILLKPLGEITAATAQVAAGDLDKQINFRGHNDFRELIHNFNIMTTNLRFQYHELEKLSGQDYLTGLANRRYFEQQLKLELERACRLNHSSTVLLLDIDDFKLINDKFGHLEGDKALKNLALVLNNTLREVDLPARFGGEEFIVLLPETTIKQARIVAEKIRESISQIRIIGRKGTISFTVSIGMAGTEQLHEFEEDTLLEAFERLLKRADRALYLAKSNGKNRVEENTK
jgi:diguanylate cyclase (GGDEF)-like protein